MADTVVVSDRLTSKAPESAPIRLLRRLSAAGAQQGLEVVPVGRVHESVDAAADHRLERLADERREARVGVQDVAARA